MSTAEVTGRVGRPRRYDDAEELERLFDATLEVVVAKGHEEITVADILAEAGLSTRSFYRHFSSKDELLDATFRRGAERFSAAVADSVAAAAHPRAALEAWLEEILSLGYGGPRTARVTVLRSLALARALSPDETARARGLLAEPLIEVLRAGRAVGTFTATDPVADAPMINAIAWDASRRIGEATGRAAKDRLRAATLDFVRRAVGETPA